MIKSINKYFTANQLLLKTTVLLQLTISGVMLLQFMMIDQIISYGNDYSKILISFLNFEMIIISGWLVNFYLVLFKLFRHNAIF